MGVKSMFEDGKFRIAAIALVVAVLVVAVVFFFMQRNELPHDVQPLITDLIKVHIKGAVNNPGVYSIEREARLEDLVELAGGLTKSADKGAVNLAQFLRDGTDIVIPNIPDEKPSEQEDGSDNLININTADQRLLETLPGIGQATAIKIVNFREKNGPLKQADDLLKINGITADKLDDIRNLIKFE